MSFKKIININKQDALDLYNRLTANELSQIANNLREDIDGNTFEFCSIINAKSGLCSENCKFCAQSSYYNTNIKTYDFINIDDIVSKAIKYSEKGINRFSVVTSGNSLNEKEIAQLCKAAKEIRKKCDIGLCVSIGLVSENSYRALLEAGITRIHNNLETSKNYYPNICTTHTYKDKVESIYRAKEMGFEICSGGLFGLGETIDDRIDLAFEVKELGVKSMPINILNPIKGTPFENNPSLSKEEIEKCIAIIKIINPEITIRMAGGRNLLPDNGKDCFLSGSNAAITGNFLTTSGSPVEDDIKMIKKMKFRLSKNYTTV